MAYQEASSKKVNSAIYTRGFTLIELLVVMLIIALLAAGVSQVINPSGSIVKRINRQGDQLWAQMQFALDDALFHYRPIGLVIITADEQDFQLTRKYRWVRYDGENWLDTEPPLGDHNLDEVLMWSIDVEAVSLAESLDELLEADATKIKPIIVFYPSGEVSQFSLILTPSDPVLQSNEVSREALNAGNQQYQITLNERGQLVRYPVGEAPDQ